MRTLAELSLPVDEHTVVRALEWLEATGEQAGWPARTRFKLRLCLDETLTNVAMYGYEPPATGGAAPRVQLHLLQSPSRLTLRIMDNGAPFDPTARAPRDLDSSLDDAQIGGHGLRLMMHYLEDIRYERRDGWNCLDLVAVIDDAR